MDNIYASPKSSLIDTRLDADAIKRKKKYVVMPKDVILPNRCFKCNEETSKRKKLRLSYVNPWIYLSLFINLLITLILVVIFQKKFTIDLPLCELHLRKRKQFLIVQWSALLGTLSLLGLGIVFDEPIALSVSMLIFLVVILMAIFSRLAYIAKHKDDLLWIKGAGKPFIESLKEYNPS
ncbi:MAG: hypothetical protein OEZ68_15610 [Gammaproteobacteria bacterium]|nr:hypothetical protein [Gammaproteobacteria bacterium]MDH5802229.1 hypothetical protein [Gammaproteobacteria bacterium]